MAKTEVIMPQMGESITTGTITKWHKKVGDLIELDEILFEISTDKVESEIPSPVAGKIVSLLYPEGATIDVGKTIAWVDDDVNAAVESNSPSKSVPTTGAATMAENNFAAKSGLPITASKSEVASEGESGDKKFFTPLVKKMAQEAGVSLQELATLKGTGSAGRVNREDFEKYLAQRQKPKASSGERSSVAVSSMPSSGKTASGSTVGRTEIIPMDNMRKMIAKNMVESKKISPHVNSIGEVDLSHLVKFRESFKNQFEKQEGFKLTYTPFILRAIILALKEYPLVNASVENENIIVKKDIHLGLAVAVPGNGLIVPNIKNADTYSMLGLCRIVNDLANKARTKKLTMDDLTGGTFTFTNVGSFGTLMATPIILQPQVGIYASGVIKKRPIVTQDDAIAIRSMMYGTHTYDHRLVDGELGGKFLEAVHQNLVDMNPQEMF